MSSMQENSATACGQVAHQLFKKKKQKKNRQTEK
jgi:hypothetical protein